MPKDPRPWAALAQTYWKLHRNQLASAAAKNAERFGARDPAVLHTLALFYAQTGDLAKAGGFESRYAALAPQDREALPRAVGLFVNARQPKQAIEAIHKTAEWETRPDLRNLLGKSLALDGQIESAAEELRAAIRLNPYDESYIFDLANLFLRLERFKDAIPVLIEGRRSFDKSPQIELALGVAYYGLRRFDDAIEQFLRTVALAPGTEQPYVFLGRMLDQAGSRLPRVLAGFEQYKIANPTNYLGYLLHAKALKLTGADAGAIEADLRRSIELDARQWESHSELSMAMEKRGDPGAAAAELQLATTLDPANAALHYRLARLYDRLNRPEQARLERDRHQALSAPAKVP